jgi:hypothetical protein
VKDPAELPVVSAKPLLEVPRVAGVGCMRFHGIRSKDTLYARQLEGSQTTSSQSTLPKTYISALFSSLPAIGLNIITVNREVLHFAP